MLTTVFKVKRCRSTRNIANPCKSINYSCKHCKKVCNGKPCLRSVKEISQNVVFCSRFIQKSKSLQCKPQVILHFVINC